MKYSLLIGTVFLVVCLVYGQGPLSPPGPPGPVMRSLEQIEPRCPISRAPFVINEPGSYYLTMNLQVSAGSAILIVTNCVTLDLNGFTITSFSSKVLDPAISINGGLRSITIKNGVIRGGVTNDGSGNFKGGGFASGIYYFPAAGPLNNVRVREVRIEGCLLSGINLGTNGGTTVKNCQVRTVGGTGIIAQNVFDSEVTDCGSDGISCVVGSRNYAESVSGCGIVGVVIRDSRGKSKTGIGISGQCALNCWGESVSGHGIRVCQAQNCLGKSESSFGVYAMDTAIGCVGESQTHTGLRAMVACGCHGLSVNGTGLVATSVHGCYGESINGGVGVEAEIASFCIGSRVNGCAIASLIGVGCYAPAGTNHVTYRYNMP